MNSSKPTDTPIASEEPTDDQRAVAQHFSDPAFREVFNEVTLEWAAVARTKVAPPEVAISGQRHYQHRWITRSSTIALVASSVLSLSCVAALGFDLDFAWLVGSLTVIAGTGLPALLLAEVFFGAGWHVQTQYRTATGFRRAYHFEPALGSARQAAVAVVAVLVSNLLGFGALYRWMSLHVAGSFDYPLSGLNATYFSAVTFGTVGYGDIVPVGPAARTVATVQIAVSFLSNSFMIATLVAWVLSQHQSRTEAAAEDLKSRVESNEAVLKQAGLGLYDRTGAFAAEVMRRARERGVVRAEADDEVGAPDPLNAQANP